MKRSLAIIVTLFSLAVFTVFSTSSVASATGTAAKNAAKTQTRTVYIKQMKSVDGKVRITVDPIGWYMGKDADVKFKEREPQAYKEIGGAPDGYYITNDSKRTVSYSVAANAKVMMQIYDRTGKMEDIDIKWNEHVTLKKFQSIYRNSKLMDVRSFPYHITIKDGQVIKIVQQFVP
ncbi:hypothetical protein EJP77_07355 [Paenibacillus zeisoli]|uniref:DUF4309 domain-containing protein n=1 Tax=Paenibacillus zeisoli TaxID=2496267 RepID=A0A433XHB1_9BACL|nr:hypothetical protein [Paenibacillus zeisoli]RUT33458.1 hypothetical protein EJP77_07355 [Paenibacillus zeisoli]